MRLCYGCGLPRAFDTDTLPVGLPVPEKIEPPAVPKGWKVSSILPLHSPAMSGGGVSENFFKEMMAEMQGQAGMPQLPGMPGAATAPEPRKKKEKKKGKV